MIQMLRLSRMNSLSITYALVENFSTATLYTVTVHFIADPNNS